MTILLAAVLPSSMGTSVRAVFLVIDAHVDSFVVGLYYYATSLLSIIVTYYAGRDRIDRFRPVQVSTVTSVFAIASALCVLASSQSPLFLVGAVLASSAASLGGSSIFMYDERYGPRGNVNAGLFRTRLLLSVSWIVGPPLSFGLYSLAGFAAVTGISVALIVASTAAMIVVSLRTLPLPKLESPPQQARSGGSNIGFWPIFVVMVATTCANVLHSLSLPLYLVETKGASSHWAGWIMALAAAVEVAVISRLQHATSATSDETVLWSGLVVGVIYFALLMFVTEPALILVCQLLYGAHFAATTVVCLPLLRRAKSTGTGSLAAQFNNAGRIGALLGAAIFGILASPLGYHWLLVVGCQSLLVSALLVGIVRYLRRRARNT